MASVIMAGSYKPAPHERPIAAVVRMMAAVVNPLMFSPCFKIAPPPIKPMPVITVEIIRVGSPLPVSVL